MLRPRPQCYLSATKIWNTFQTYLFDFCEPYKFSHQPQRSLVSYSVSGKRLGSFRLPMVILSVNMDEIKCSGSHLELLCEGYSQGYPGPCPRACLLVTVAASTENGYQVPALCGHKVCAHLLGAHSSPRAAIQSNTRGWLQQQKYIILEIHCSGP